MRKSNMKPMLYFIYRPNPVEEKGKAALENIEVQKDHDLGLRFYCSYMTVRINIFYPNYLRNILTYRELYLSDLKKNILCKKVVSKLEYAACCVQYIASLEGKHGVFYT